MMMLHKKRKMLFVYFDVNIFYVIHKLREYEMVIVREYCYYHFRSSPRLRLVPVLRNKSFYQ